MDASDHVVAGTIERGCGHKRLSAAERRCCPNARDEKVKESAGGLVDRWLY